MPEPGEAPQRPPLSLRNRSARARSQSERSCSSRLRQDRSDPCAAQVARSRDATVRAYRCQGCTSACLSLGSATPLVDILEHFLEIGIILERAEVPFPEALFGCVG